MELLISFLWKKVGLFEGGLFIIWVYLDLTCRCGVGVDLSRWIEEMAFCGGAKGYVMREVAWMGEKMGHVVESCFDRTVEIGWGQIMGE